MTPSSLLALLAGNAKLTVAVAATAAATAGGGLAVASSVTAGNAHAATGLSHATAAAPVLPAAATAHVHGAAAAGHAAGTHGRPAVTPVACNDATSHGQYVSSIARQAPDPSNPGAHGRAVAAAAQSDCGKPSGAGSDTGGTDPQDTEAPESDSGDSQGDTGTPNAHATSHPTGKPTALPGHASSHVPSH